MLKRLIKWTELYWPSIIFTLFLAGIYLVSMWFLFDFVWPLALANAEPVYVAATFSFKEACLQAYQALGATALVLYILYSLNGLLSMSHEAHRRFSKDCRLTAMEGYALLAFNVVISLFTLPNVRNLYTISTIITVMSFVLLVVYLIRLVLFISWKKRVRKSYWGWPANLVAFLFSAAVALVLTVLPDVLNGVVNLLNLIPCVNQLGEQSAMEKYVLRLWVDGSLLVIPVIGGVFLFLLMRNASPLAASMPNGRAPRAWVHAKDLN
jgi:hypothetical protein